MPPPDVICPTVFLYQLNGIYYYDAEYCPTGLPQILESETELSTNGCVPPYEDCKAVSELNVIGAGNSLSLDGGLRSTTGVSVHYGGTLAVAGLGRDFDPSDQVPSTTHVRQISADNCTFFDPISQSQKWCRLFVVEVVRANGSTRQAFYGHELGGAIPSNTPPVTDLVIATRCTLDVRFANQDYSVLLSGRV